MKIDERIEEVQSKLIKILTETNLENKEEGIKLLERWGLDTEYATKILEAFRNAESARNAVKNAWNTTLNSRPEDGISADIANSQQQELETRQRFDSVNAKCALLIVARTLDPNKINNEVLGRLYEQGIREEEIDNPTVKITYHYYCVAKEKENERKEDLEKYRTVVDKVKFKIAQLEKRIEELEAQNKRTYKSYIRLYDSYSTRIAEDEKHYQDALLQNKELKKQVNQLQGRGIFQMIRDKILRRNKTRRLPGGSTELPKTLNENTAEKVGVPKVDEDVLNRTSNPNKTVDDNIKLTNLPKTLDK